MILNNSDQAKYKKKLNDDWFMHHSYEDAEKQYLKTDFCFSKKAADIYFVIL